MKTGLASTSPARRVLATGYLLIGLGFALNVFARTAPELVACIIIFTLGEMVAMPVSAAYVSNLAPANLRGRYLGVNGLNWSLALIIAPSLGMKLLAYSPMALWLGCGAFGVMGAVVISIEMREGKTALASEGGFN